VPQEFNFNIFEPVGEIIANQGGYYGVPSTVEKSSPSTFSGNWDYGINVIYRPEIYPAE